jgi:signal transduction histidine kinase
MALPSAPKPTTQPGPAAGSPMSDPCPAMRQTLAGLEDELVACQRLVALGNMAAAIAHEINNLMTPVLSRADFALSSGAAPDMRQALERTKTHVERAVAVTQRLMDLAYDRQWPLESCNALEVVNEALATIARPFDKDGITLTLSVPPDLYVRGRRDLLIQILLNLMLNARTAMKQVRGPLKVSAWRDGTDVVLEVCDSGRGLPPEQIERVLNPFLASPGNHGRDWQLVGLGLNVCRLIAHKFNARISARANHDRGCTFSLRWPAT